MYEQNTCKNTWKKAGKRKQNFQFFFPNNQIITIRHIKLRVQEMTMNEKLIMIGLMKIPNFYLGHFKISKKWTQ